MILLTSINQPNYQVLADKTWPNKVEYCQRHGYESYLKNDNFYDAGLVLGFEKIYYIKEILKTRPDIEWGWFLGCDAIITNFTRKIEEVIALSNGHSFIVGKDINGINMDSFLVKNDENGRWILEEVWNSRAFLNHTWCYEQQWFWNNAGHHEDKILVVPQRLFNSYQYDLYGMTHEGNWMAGDFVIHWPGLDLQQRLELFEKYNKMIMK